VQTSDPAKIVEAMLGDETPDPKEIAMRSSADSELFDDFMRRYTDECRHLIAQAKASGALSGNESEGFVIRAVMQIAAKNFWLDTAVAKDLLRNLNKFI
jgi:hypothetical protein